jgi:mannose-binding lectin 2
VVLALLLSLSEAEWNTNDFLKREHSLIKPYQGTITAITLIQLLRTLSEFCTYILTGTGFGIPNWDFLGSVMVTGSYVRLTPNEQSKQGALWNKLVSCGAEKPFKYI